MYRHLLCVAVAVALATPAWAAETNSTNQRLQSLEQRVDRLETAPGSTAPSSIASFNPAVSVVLSGVYANLSEDPANYHISGFPLPADTEFGPGDRGFSLAESELAIYANIDPYFYGQMVYSMAPDDTASVEEAYIQTIDLGKGFTAKAGRFFSGIGYLNSQHSHVWDFVDAPLVYQAFLGSQYDDDGVQLKWLAPTDTFIELGTELSRGRGFPGSNRDKNGAGAETLFAHIGGDIGFSNSWRAGLSLLNTSPRDRTFAETDLAGNNALNSFNGHSRTYVVDAVWKYAPNGDTVYTNFKLQAEYMRRHEDGAVDYALTPDADGNLISTQTAPYDGKQSGWYLQAVYQFMPYWRVGLRTERLDHGSVDYGANNANLQVTDYNPSRNTAMVDYSLSEFSRIRLQYAQDKAYQGATDKQIFVQYLMSMGSHGAHIF
jgi:hypothetical protein